MEHAMLDVEALIKRIQSGMTTQSDAELVKHCLVRLAQYELEDGRSVTASVPYENLAQ